MFVSSKSRRLTEIIARQFVDVSKESSSRFHVNDDLPCGGRTHIGINIHFFTT